MFLESLFKRFATAEFVMPEFLKLATRDSEILRFLFEKIFIEMNIAFADIWNLDCFLMEAFL